MHSGVPSEPSVGKRRGRCYGSLTCSTPPSPPRYVGRRCGRPCAGPRMAPEALPLLACSLASAVLRFADDLAPLDFEAPARDLPGGARKVRFERLQELWERCVLVLGERHFATQTLLRLQLYRDFETKYARADVVAHLDAEDVCEWVEGLARAHHALRRVGLGDAGLFSTRLVTDWHRPVNFAERFHAKARVEALERKLREGLGYGLGDGGMRHDLDNGKPASAATQDSDTKDEDTRSQLDPDDCEEEEDEDPAAVSPQERCRSAIRRLRYLSRVAAAETGRSKGCDEQPVEVSSLRTDDGVL